MENCITIKFVVQILDGRVYPIVSLQGYHDICLTFLLVLGEDECLPVIDSITMSHLK